jgi:hypothetical protein
MKTIRHPTLVRILPLLLAGLAACGNDFDPSSKVQSVRILASRADKPYAKPGDSVELELLAIDGRNDRSRPMALSWIPTPCINPRDDAYENCFSSFERMFARGVDLTSQLIGGPRLSLQIPADILTRGASMQSGAPFGTVFAFGAACAGHIEYVGRRGSSPRAVPFACFDSSGRELGADDFVFSYSRIFVFADRANANPVIEGLALNGQTIDPAAGIVVDHCATPSRNGQDSTCPTYGLELSVPATSQELDPSNVDVNGTVLRESLWVDYYLTGGKVKNDVRILYDAHVGRIFGSVELEAPGVAGEAMLWAVAHDNRGGVTWTSVPIHAR